MLRRGVAYTRRTIILLPEFEQALAVCPVRVAVSPASAELATGEQKQFTHTVTGHDNQAVNWSATGGTITGGGLYAAPAEAGTYEVRATSHANPQRSATATVTVTPNPLAGTYHGTHKDYDFGDCGNPCEDHDATAVVEVDGNAFTLYYFNGTEAGNTATCGTAAHSGFCIKYTGTWSGGGLTGTGVRDPDVSDYRDLPFDATRSGSVLTGTAYWDNDCPGGCYYDFRLTRDP
jgi:hypothetical protein